jgi:hypothetical protein
VNTATGQRPTTSGVPSAANGANRPRVSRRRVLLFGAVGAAMAGVLIVAVMRRRAAGVQQVPPIAATVQDRAPIEQPAEIEQWERLARDQQELTLKQTAFLQKYGGKLPADVGPELTPEQQAAFVELVKNQGRGARPLFEEYLARSGELLKLRQQLQDFEKRLPQHIALTADDKKSHLTHAVEFLQSKGLTNAQAYALVAKVNVQELLVPGFNIWLYYNGGQFGTWVTQGTARVTPMEHQRMVAEVTQMELSDANGKLKKQQANASDLVNLLNLSDVSRQKLEADLTAARAELRNNAQAAVRASTEANTIYYVVDCKDSLIKRQIIDKTYGLTNPAGGQPLNLLEAKDIGFEATCLKAIKRVVLTPGRFTSDVDFKLAINGPTGRLTILNVERFKTDARFLTIVLE